MISLSVALGLGPFQFLRGLRTKHPALHRWIGRFYLLGILLGGVAGLYMATFAYTGPVASFGFGTLALLWLITGALAYHFSRTEKAKKLEDAICRAIHKANGEAKEFICDGAIEIGGRLPINTHGGQLGEAYIHGMNGIAEMVRQVRGTAVNQVANVENVLATAGTGVPTSGLILGAE